MLLHTSYNYRELANTQQLIFGTLFFPWWLKWMQLVHTHPTISCIHPVLLSKLYYSRFSKSRHDSMVSSIVAWTAVFFFSGTNWMQQYSDWCTHQCRSSPPTPPRNIHTHTQIVIWWMVTHLVDPLSRDSMDMQLATAIRAWAWWQNQPFFPGRAVS